jgi:hypothetical protein
VVPQGGRRASGRRGGSGPDAEHRARQSPKNEADPGGACGRWRGQPGGWRRSTWPRGAPGDRPGAANEPWKERSFQGRLAAPPPNDPGLKAVLERTGSPNPCDEGEDLLKGGLVRRISESREAPGRPRVVRRRLRRRGRGPLAPVGGGWRSSPAGSGWRTRPPSTPWRCWGGSRRPCSLGSNLRNRDSKRMAHARFSLFYNFLQSLSVVRGAARRGATEAKRKETKAVLRELGLAEDLGPR